jgi:hypothetical protein
MRSISSCQNLGRPCRRAQFPAPSCSHGASIWRILLPSCYVWTSSLERLGRRQIVLTCAFPAPFSELILCRVGHRLMRNTLPIALWIPCTSPVSLVHSAKLVIVVFAYSFKFSSGSQVLSLSLKPFHFISTQEVCPDAVSCSKLCHRDCKFHLSPPFAPYFIALDSFNLIPMYD